MQAAAGRTACLAGRAAEAPHGHPLQQLALVPPRRRPAARRVITASFGAAAAGGGMSAQSMGMVAQAVGFGLAALFVGLQLKHEQDAMEREGRRECETCAGTGLVPCICLKWSDSDVGCGACGGSGMMECTSCGGGGTAVPIEAKVYVKGGGTQHRTYY